MGLHGDGLAARDGDVEGFGGGEGVGGQVVHRRAALCVDGLALDVRPIRLDPPARQAIAAPLSGAGRAYVGDPHALPEGEADRLGGEGGRRGGCHGAPVCVHREKVALGRPGGLEGAGLAGHAQPGLGERVVAGVRHVAEAGDLVAGPDPQPVLVVGVVGAVLEVDGARVARQQAHPHARAPALHREVGGGGAGEGLEGLVRDVDGPAAGVEGQVVLVPAGGRLAKGRRRQALGGAGGAVAVALGRGRERGRLLRARRGPEEVVGCVV